MTIWPFGRKHPALSELPPLSQDGSWGVAQDLSGGSPLIVRYNTTAANWCGHPELTIKLGFAIPFKRPHEGGLPDPDENARLNEIEDVIVREIDSRTRAFHALTLTTGTMKEFVFYLPQGVDIKSLHEAIRSCVTTHEVQCMAVVERNWDSYQQFAPK
jgi:hypothetical protein